MPALEAHPAGVSSRGTPAKCFSSATGRARVASRPRCVRNRRPVATHLRLLDRSCVGGILAGGHVHRPGEHAVPRACGLLVREQAAFVRRVGQLGRERPVVAQGLAAERHDADRAPSQGQRFPNGVRSARVGPLRAAPPEQMLMSFLPVCYCCGRRSVADSGEVRHRPIWLNFADSAELWSAHGETNIGHLGRCSFETDPIQARCVAARASRVAGRRANVHAGRGGPSQ